MRVDGELIDMFEVKRDMKQGSILSLPLLSPTF